MSARFIPHQMAKGESVTFAQSWNYWAVDDIEAMLRFDYFLPWRDQFWSGDTLRICQMRDGEIRAPTNRLLAFVDLIVVAKPAGRIVFEPVGEIRYMPLEDEEKEISKQDAQKRAIGEVKWRGPYGKWGVVDKDGVVIVDKIAEKDEAQAIASGEKAVPESLVPEMVA